MLVTWFLVWVFRREKTGFQCAMFYVSWAAITFLSCCFFADFEDFSRCAFSLQGKKKLLSFLTFSLSILKSRFLI